MKAIKFIVGVCGLFCAPVTWAGTSTSSASAESGLFGPGSATATAGYDGNGIGIARTNTHSGAVNFGQGVSLGFDEDGLSLSTSYAVAPQFGPAAAGTFNLALGTDGTVAHSVGQTVASGGAYRGVGASGAVSPGSRFGHGQAPVAVADVGGRTGPGGRVDAWTHSDTGGRILGSRSGIAHTAARQPTTHREHKGVIRHTKHASRIIHKSARR